MAAAHRKKGEFPGSRSCRVFRDRRGARKNKPRTDGFSGSAIRCAEGVNRTFLFAPGAGAPSTHPWTQSWRDRLQQLGEVQLFDYDYMRARRKRPDPLPLLIAAHRSALAALRGNSDAPIFLIGKSMGGRIGCHV